MNNIKAIEESYPDIKFLMIEEYQDEAIIGVSEGLGSSANSELNEHRLVYDSQKCIEIYMREEGWSYEEALEHFSTNTLGSYMGPETPIFVNKPFIES
jgi:hypothetical protein